MVRSFLQVALCCCAFAFVGCKPGQLFSVSPEAVKAEVTTQVEAKLAETVQAEVKATIASPEITGKIADTIKTEVQSSVDVAVDKRFQQSTGDQSTGEKGVNIGSIALEGGPVVAVVGAVLVLGVGFLIFWKKHGKKKDMVEMLVACVEAKEDKPLKDMISGESIRRGLAYDFDRLVQKTVGTKPGMTRGFCAGESNK